MSFGKSSSALRSLMCWAAVFVATMAFTPRAQALQHFWSLQEIYSNNTGTLQFIELQTAFGSQQFVGGFSINSSNIGNTQTNMFTIPTNLPSDSANHTFLIATAGVQAAGGPAPDYIMPNGFLFTAGGTLNFFGTNSGPYTALPIDGTMSRIWGGGNNLVNSPRNFAFQTGTVVVPEPTTMILTPVALGMYGLYRRVSRRRTEATLSETP